MKLWISLLTAAKPGPDSDGFRGQVQRPGCTRIPGATVDAAYACTTEQDLQRIAGHRNDVTELHMVESIRCYYLIPGAILQVIKVDPARGMSHMRLLSINRSLWTSTRFLSKQPVQDTYGVFETPTSSGFIPTADTGIVPARSSDSSTTQARLHGH